jgi:hypothetical protein
MLWLQEYFHPGGIALSILANTKLESSLRDLMARPWWTRLWVMQELLLAQRAYLYCGRKVVAWPTRGKIGLPIHRRLLFHFGEGRSSPVGYLLMLQQVVHKKPELLDIFMHLQHRQSTDPRDRVFAILDLVDEVNAALNSPDYTLSLLEVQRRLVITSVKTHKDLRVLSYARGVHSYRTHSRVGQPSWTPRWGEEIVQSRKLGTNKEKPSGSVTEFFLRYPLELGICSYTLPKPFAFRQFDTSSAQGFL